MRKYSLAAAAVAAMVLASAAKAIPTVSFQNGVNGYTGAVDIQPAAGYPTAVTDVTNLDIVWSDYPSTGSTNPDDMGDQVLLRFDNIFGNGPGQVPFGATVSASLTLTTAPASENGPGAGGTFHRMLVPWTSTDTWSTLGNGIQPDGIKATAGYNTSAGNSSLTPNVPAGPTSFDVTADVQAWSKGAPNYGWAILPWTGGTDGWGILDSETTIVSQRPELTISYSVHAPEPASAVLLLGGVAVLIARGKRLRGH